MSRLLLAVFVIIHMPFVLQLLEEVFLVSMSKYCVKDYKWKQAHYLFILNKMFAIFNIWDDISVHVSSVALVDMVDMHSFVC